MLKLITHIPFITGICGHMSAPDGRVVSFNTPIELSDTLPYPYHPKECRPRIPDKPRPIDFQVDFRRLQSLMLYLEEIGCRLTDVTFRSDHFEVRLSLDESCPRLATEIDCQAPVGNPASWFISRTNSLLVMTTSKEFKQVVEEIISTNSLIREIRRKTS